MSMEANNFAGEEKKTMSVFEQELQRMRMPPQLVKLLQEKASQFKPLVDVMNEKSRVEKYWFLCYS